MLGRSQTNDDTRYQLKLNHFTHGRASSSTFENNDEDANKYMLACDAACYEVSGGTTSLAEGLL